MTLFSEQDLQDRHRESFANRARLSGAKDCGCFHCLSHFPEAELEYWDDAPDQTAVCPRCGIDSVIAEHVEEAVSDDLLNAMKKHFFW